MSPSLLYISNINNRCMVVAVWKSQITALRCTLFLSLHTEWQTSTTRDFNDSVPVFRAFLCVGFFLSALWAGIHVCAPDAFAWSIGLVFLNAVHTAILACRFLPPPLSIELTELYLKLFKPLRVSKKHFKELTREGQLLHLEPGETYAVEEATPADERLSVLLRGK